MSNLGEQLGRSIACAMANQQITGTQGADLIEYYSKLERVNKELREALEKIWDVKPKNLCEDGKYCSECEMQYDDGTKGCEGEPEDEEEEPTYHGSEVHNKIQETARKFNKSINKKEEPTEEKPEMTECIDEVHKSMQKEELANIYRRLGIIEAKTVNRHTMGQWMHELRAKHKKVDRLLEKLEKE